MSLTVGGTCNIIFKIKKNIQNFVCVCEMVNRNEEFIQFERTESSSRDHSIISAGDSISIVSLSFLYFNFQNFFACDSRQGMNGWWVDWEKWKINFFNCWEETRYKACLHVCLSVCAYFNSIDWLKHLRQKKISFWTVRK